ncbi:hypothetical protein [Streptomyces sp. 8L]|uniref:hypothetical protein n=1 Tax=Streptomyces sp. 8L TaxID=2877242 RepID=UPI001CD4C95E|nr:hypothetical protein [Streptomyces sp. 8L]MCA1220728.1 hypothetical protein [Streptomyces sp. 8L]
MAGGDWNEWPGTAIIIHSGGKAHFPGCSHFSPADVRPPVYGWVLAPSPGAWRRLAPSHPLHATHGNRELVAVSRCMTCDGTR